MNSPAALAQMHAKKTSGSDCAARNQCDPSIEPANPKKRAMIARKPKLIILV
jgi:hypothetical protein